MPFLFLNLTYNNTCYINENWNTFWWEMPTLWILKTPQFFFFFFLKLSRMTLSFNFVAKLASNSNKALWVCHRTLNATSILRDLEPIPKFQIKRFVCLCCKFKLTPKNPYDISKLTISIIIISFFGKGKWNFVLCICFFFFFWFFLIFCLV